MLELDDDRKAALARTLEESARVLASVRYGTAFAFGAGYVVLNPDDPVAAGSFASGLDAPDLGTVERTLLALPLVWAEAGRRSVVVLASPSSAPELDLLAEECGYEAAEELSTMLLTEPRQLVDGEPGIRVRPLPERDEHRVGALVAAAHGWSPGVARRLQVVQGHRLDDPRHVAFGAWDGEELVGVATGFLHGATGQVVEVCVDAAHRRRRLGRALASAVATTLLARGARLVWLTAEQGGLVERCFTGLGFEAAYDAVLFTCPVDGGSGGPECGSG